MSCKSNSCCESSGAAPASPQAIVQLCARGCPLVDGICPISDEEWNQALQEKKSKEALQATEEGTSAAARAASLEERRRWQKRAIILSIFTIVYGIAEGTIGLALGAETVSISLLAFGADSWVEVISGCMVCWRFYEELANIDKTITARTATAKERAATVVLGLLLSILSLAVIGGSIGALAVHDTPESGLVNIIVGAVSVAYMGTLYVLKTRVAIALKSSTVETDAQCSLFCVQLSLVLLVGAIIFREVSSVWWFDSATAIVIALLIGKEGVETVRTSQKKDFTGAGCGCDGDDDGLLMRWMRKKLKGQPAATTSKGSCDEGLCADKVGSGADGCGNQRIVVGEKRDNVECASASSKPSCTDRCKDSIKANDAACECTSGGATSPGISSANQRADKCNNSLESTDGACASRCNKPPIGCADKSTGVKLKDGACASSCVN